MEQYALFTDASLNPRLKCGVGAYLVLPAVVLDTVPDNINVAVKTRRFENTTSTGLEIRTALWAIESVKEEYSFAGNNRLTVYCDSQCVVGLPARRVKLETNNYCSKAKQRPLNNAELYRAFYRILDDIQCEIIKIAGHAPAKSHTVEQRIFSCVDKKARKELRKWLDTQSA